MAFLTEFRNSVIKITKYVVHIYNTDNLRVFNYIYKRSQIKYHILNSMFKLSDLPLTIDNGIKGCYQAHLILLRNAEVVMTNHNIKR